MDLSKFSTEELMRMRGGDAAPRNDLSSISTEELMKMRGADDPTGSFTENVKAGAGKVFYDLARGAGQMVRDYLEAPLKDADMLSKHPRTVSDLVVHRKADTQSKIADALGLPTQEDINEVRRVDQPLMGTAGGKVGNIGASAALLAPTALIPGANTPVGAGIVGGAMGALQPVAEGESRAKNAVVGTAVAGGTQAVLGKIAGSLEQRAARKAEEAAVNQAQNATRDAALEAGRKAGYVAPPASVNPGLKNEMLESVSGKIATQQASSMRNQKVTDQLAREYLGFGKDSILTKASIADAKNVAAEPYRQVAALSDEASKALDLWKQANFDAKRWWNYARKSGNPEAFDKAIVFSDASENALNVIESEAEKLGRSALVDSLKAARVKLGKLSTVESALTSGGHVDANVIAKLGERFPFTDQLKVIADFAGQFPKAMRAPEKIGGMAHALRPGIGAGVGTMIGGPAGTVVGAGTGVAVPWTVRQMILSGPGQAALATPSYGGGGAARTIAELLDAPLNRALLPQAATAAALQNRP